MADVLNILDVANNANLTNAAFTAGVATAEISAADAKRDYLLVQNNDATDDMFVQFGAAATLTTGVKIPAGGFYEPLTVPRNSVNVIGSAAGVTSVIVTG